MLEGGYNFGELCFSHSKQIFGSVTAAASRNILEHAKPCFEVLCSRRRNRNEDGLEIYHPNVTTSASTTPRKTRARRSLAAVAADEPSNHPDRVGTTSQNLQRYNMVGLLESTDSWRTPWADLKWEHRSHVRHQTDG